MYSQDKSQGRAREHVGVSHKGFAKLCNKQPRVFDQKVNGWFRWAGESWEAEAEPVIHHTAIAGGGTRVLQDNGLAAINELFDRSFGS